MVIIKVLYTKPLNVVDKYRAAHLAYYQKLSESNKILIGGRLKDNSGGIMICNFADLVEVQSVIANDPYKINDVAQYSLIDFGPVVIAEPIKNIVKH